MATQQPGTDRLAVTRTDSPPDSVVLAVAGEIDICNAPRLRQVIHDTLADSRVRRLALDFAALDYIDSSGVSALISGLRLATTNGARFTVIRPQRGVLRVLNVLGLGSVLAPDGCGWA